MRYMPLTHSSSADVAPPPLCCCSSQEAVQEPTLQGLLSTSASHPPTMPACPMLLLIPLARQSLNRKQRYESAVARVRSATTLQFAGRHAH